TAARISGAHINPAVTVALAVFKGFPWRKVIPYSLAQVAGAFVAALLVRWNYTEVLHAADPGLTIKTQFVFSTLPGNGTLPVETWGAFRDQIIGTAILLFLVLAVTDLQNTAPLANLAPFIIGLIVVAIGMAWGTNAGYAINPARDFGPRLASWLTGYETAWRDQYGALYFWVPILGPLIGGVIGAGLYQLLVGRFLPIAEEPPPGRSPQDTERAEERGRCAVRRRTRAAPAAHHRAGENDGRFRRGARPGNDGHPFHDLRPRRQRDRPPPARTRADPAPGRLGRAQPDRDLGAHPRGHRNRAHPG